MYFNKTSNVYLFSQYSWEVMGAVNYIYTNLLRIDTVTQKQMTYSPFFFSFTESPFKEPNEKEKYEEGRKHAHFTFLTTLMKQRKSYSRFSYN